LSCIPFLDSNEQQYAYDLAGRVVSYDNDFEDFTIGYAYDAVDQLTSEDRPGSGNDGSYAYDAGGNRTSDANAAYQVGAYNRLQSDDDHAYAYDDEGNLVRKTNLSDGYYVAYSWDHRNRLAGVAWYDDEDVLLDDLAYGYDAFNQLITDASRTFAYDGGQVVLRFSGDNLKERYLWGAAVDELLATESVASLVTPVDNETLWALTDSQGSVRDLLDSSGTERKHIAYDAFGNIQSEAYYYENGLPIEGTEPSLNAQAVDQAFFYTGRLLDRDTGLQNNLNRWYDPNIGRWLSEDPIGFGGGDANLYRYVGNSPTNLTDPSGLFFPWDWFREWQREIELDRQLDKLRLNRAQAANALNPGSSSGLNQLTRLQCDQRKRAAGDIRALANVAIYFDEFGFSGGFLSPGSSLDDFEWRGQPGSKPGGKQGNFYNPKTCESIRPDLIHPGPIGPHLDYRDPDGKWWRIYNDGRKEAK
jgi:RHS repeat-associated protein